MAADVWSLGALLHLLLTLETPFQEHSWERHRERVLNEPVDVFNSKKLRGVSGLCKSLLFSMLEKNPRFRIQIDEVLRHPWICKADDPLFLE